VFLNLCVLIVHLILGGYDGTTFLSSIECYDPDAEKWSEVAKMTCGRSGHGVAVGIEPNCRSVSSCCANSVGHVKEEEEEKGRRKRKK